MAVFGTTADDRNFKFWNGILAACVGVPLNLLLLYAVVMRSPKWLRPYTKIFYLEIFVNIGYSLLNTFVTTIYFSAVIDGHFYYFHVVNGIIHEPPQPFTTLCVLPLVFFLNWNITVVPVNFIYRYLAVCHKYEMSTLTFLGTIALSTIGPLIYVIAIAIGEFRDDHLRPSIANKFDATDWIDASGQPPNFSLMVADGITLHTVVIPIATVFTYVVVIACTIEIYRKVRKLREIQGKNQSGKNFQLNLVLVCNAVVPFIVSAIPSGGVQTAKIMDLKVPYIISQIALLTPWSAVTSPAMALIIVSPFRNFLFRPITKWICTTKKTGRLFSVNTSNENPIRSIAPKAQMTTV